MLRTRLLTALVFNLAIALWVFRDARARRAPKPAFAAVLAVLWGPLGLGLWVSDRPLRPDEHRRGAGASIAHGFLTGWVALLPAIFVLAMQVVEHRAAVPGSLGRQLGLLQATSVVALMLWGGPAVLALFLGWLVRHAAVEPDIPTAPATSLPAWLAAALAGAAALACATMMR